MAERILSEHADREVSAGNFAFADVDLAMIHDVTAPLAIDAMRRLSEEVWDPERVVLLFDHQVPADSVQAAENQRKLRGFAEEQGLPNFLGEREGVCHQVLPERGLVSPGDLVVGSDSHTCTYGALGAFSTGIGSTDMGAVLATGELWFRVPETVRFLLEGKLPEHVSAKDVILRLLGERTARGAIYDALEFHGPVVEDMDVPGRLTVCNMAVEMGAKAGMVPPDETTREYVDAHSNPSDSEFRDPSPSPDAEYSDVHEEDLSGLEPQVARPHNVDDVGPIGEVEGVGLDQVFIGSCTNGRFEDIEVAASFIEGEEIPRGTRVIVTPASRREYLRAEEAGLLRAFSEAGCMVQSPGCGPCMGGHTGLLAPGEVSLSTSNRNFRGRQGSPEAEIHLSSPATAGASAVWGEITDPREF
ncbi:MAG: Isopropylmalate/citramalate isomerase large subunit [Methanonatronarchaeales archaeon]|nr:Isopropylmalate/citramalate isomerase large subunit [Methanonatronarchaeales archaeon]